MVGCIKKLCAEIGTKSKKGITAWALKLFPVIRTENIVLSICMAWSQAGCPINGGRYDDF